ncbi:MAG: DUF1501 domain-containing protein [Mariniblastus sp.]|nr:DUF1501 domain-containing protein [Mariniblastus sp.]
MNPLANLTRRELLNRWCVGFGGLALGGLLADRQLLGSSLRDLPNDPTDQDTPSLPLPHLRPRAKRIIFLFMHGGPSHVDLFDPKPELTKRNGERPPFKRTRVQFASRGNLLGSPWKFRQVGKSGLPMSQLWQHLPQVADELCMLHSVCDTNVAHGGACMKLFTGSDSTLRPSVGSWISYGLGSENQNLPGFITICPSSLHGGVDNFGNAFLPAVHQGVSLGEPGYPNSLAKNAKFGNLKNKFSTSQEQRRQLDFLRKINHQHSAQLGFDSELEARIQSFELAFRMQTAAPEAIDLSQESIETRRLYGMDEEKTENFGQMCLLARRFAERGVRFIQISHAHSLPFNNEQWDQHSHLKQGHEINVAQIDKPITGLIKDLKQRGLLEDTLVLWGGEFGRTPTAQAGDPKIIGRDHHPEGFTMWMAGGGVKGGFRYGKTDEFGYYAIENRMPIHDLHATILHLMGLDHEQLTYKHAGRDFRLTDVYGQVATDILA